MLKVLFFGQIKEIVKTDSVDIDLFQKGNKLNSVAYLRIFLQENGDVWSEYLAYGKALVAVNQEIVNEDFVLKDGDEIAFFPPVTGG